MCVVQYDWVWLSLSIYIWVYPHHHHIYIYILRTYIYIYIYAYTFIYVSYYGYVKYCPGHTRKCARTSWIDTCQKIDHFKGQMTSNHGVKGHFELLGIDVDLHLFIYILLLAMGWLIHSIVLWNRNQIYTYWQILALNRGGMLEGFRDPQFGF